MVASMATMTDVFKFEKNTMWNDIFHLIEDKCVNRKKKKDQPEQALACLL